MVDHVKFLLVAELAILGHIHAHQIEFCFFRYLARLDCGIVELHENRVVHAGSGVVLVVFLDLVRWVQVFTAPRQLSARRMVALQARAPARFIVQVYGHYG